MAPTFDFELSKSRASYMLKGCRSLIRRMAFSSADALVAELAQHSPIFAIKASNVTVLREPCQFFETLKNGILRSEKRIVISALYLGTDHQEQELVDCFVQRLNECGTDSKFHVHVLLDCIRGSRGKVNSRSMLVPLLQSHPERMKVSLYHTPLFNHLLKYVIPDKFNETVGLQHIKIFLFDDDLVVSGANLSESYFTNRQDRYIIVKDCPHLSNFCEQLISTVGAHSYSLQPDNSLKPGRYDPLSVWTKRQFSESFGQAISNLIKHKMTGDVPRPVDRQDIADTWICPLIQMGPYGVRQDERVMSTLFQRALSGCHTFLASGYFNLTEKYVDLIIRSQGKYRILTASPQANGFLGAGGAAGHIPYAYLHIARWFHDRLVQAQQTDRIKLEEYTRDGWTFHGKGVCIVGCICNTQHYNISRQAG
jgi:CDP-diacylglycerol--glycerol-3-phosphate 3-phosphatidyltransferase